MAVLEITNTYSKSLEHIPINGTDDIVKLAERYPSMGKMLATCPDMNSMIKAVLSYLNSHSGMHAKMIGSLTEAHLSKNELGFSDRFDVWLSKRSKNYLFYDTGFNADPGPTKQPEKKQGWLKSLFSKVGL